MPRPGPRPYECERRAWHSDTHQPIRGSLIQEIFRIANEVHSSTIKKNREWQAKLPVVVLKAEEIMYSKANSEAEYADFDTVWDRANDAMDTIIRRDETSETGELLQPCIEAALHLGCTPRKSSRSKHNNMPQFYLTSERNEPVSTCSSNLNDKGYGDYATGCSFTPGNSNLLLRCNAMHSSKSSISTCGFFKPPISRSQVSSRVVHRTYSSNSWSVYPLYDGDHFPLENSKSKTSSHLMEADRGSVMRKLTPLPNASNQLSQEKFPKTSETQCDLSLRLGPL